MIVLTKGVHQAMNHGLPPQGLSEPRRVNKFFIILLQIRRGSVPSGAAALIAHNDRWLIFHFSWPIMPRVIILIVGINTTEKTRQPSL